MELQDLHARLDVGLPIFVLIDPLTGEPLPVDGIDELSSPDQLTAARACAWGRSVFAVDLDDRIITIGPQRHPYLVALTGADDPWLQETLCMATGERSASRQNGSQNAGLSAHRIGGWIQTAQAPTAMTQAFASAMVLHVSVRVSARYLRLADRRVLDWVRHVVGDERLCAALPPDLQWHFLAQCGKFEAVDTRGRGPRLPLEFALDEWKQLQDGPVHHATAARWYGAGHDAQGRCSNPQPVEGAPWALIERAVGNARRAATRHPERFRDIQDTSAWAALALRHTEDDIERAIRSLSEMPDSHQSGNWSMHSQYKTIESELSGRST